MSQSPAGNNTKVSSILDLPLVHQEVYVRLLSQFADEGNIKAKDTLKQLSLHLFQNREKPLPSTLVEYLEQVIPGNFPNKVKNQGKPRKGIMDLLGVFTEVSVLSHNGFTVEQAIAETSEKLGYSIDHTRRCYYRSKHFMAKQDAFISKMADL